MLTWSLCFSISNQCSIEDFAGRRSGGRLPSILSKKVMLQGKFLALRGRNKQRKSVSSRATAVMITDGCNLSLESFSKEYD